MENVPVLDMIDDRLEDLDLSESFDRGKHAELTSLRRDIVEERERRRDDDG